MKEIYYLVCTLNNKYQQLIIVLFNKNERISYINEFTYRYPSNILDHVRGTIGMSSEIDMNTNKLNILKFPLIYYHK